MRRQSPQRSALKNQIEMAKLQNLELSHNMIEKSLKDVTEILKSVFGENVQIDININGVEPIKLLQAYGMEEASRVIALGNGEHSMKIYSEDYLPFEKKVSLPHFGEDYLKNELGKLTLIVE